MSSKVLPSTATVEDAFNLLETEIALLGENLDPSFLERFKMFTPDHRGKKTDFDPYGLFLAHLYCFHNDIYGQRAVYRVLQDETVWRQCGFPRAPSYDPIKRFRSNFSTAAEAIFNYLVEQAAGSGLLSPTYRIDSTDVRATPQYNSDGSWNYDPTADGTYFGYAVRWSRPRTISRLPRPSQTASRSMRRRRCASRVMRAPWRNRSG